MKINDSRYYIYICLQLLFQASYGVQDPEFAITQLAQTTMRSELGKIALDSVFKERESLNASIVGKFGETSSNNQVRNSQITCEYLESCIKFG